MIRSMFVGVGMGFISASFHDWGSAEYWLCGLGGLILWVALDKTL